MYWRSLALIFLILSTCVWADLPRTWKLPSPDSRGDYTGPHHEFWEVVDPDPGGLNARPCPVDSSGQPDPRPGASVLDRPVARTFPRGTELVCSIVAKDDRNRPWFAVRTIDDHDTWYLVRASQSFLKPIYNPVPQPDENGDYRDYLQLYWTVVDPDPAGLNGRLHPNFPPDVADAGALWPEGPVSGWPVVTTLARGTTVRAISGHRGTITLKGSRGEPWILVTTSLDMNDPNQNRCFVRSNRKYVRPLRE